MKASFDFGPLIAGTVVSSLELELLELGNIGT